MDISLNGNDTITIAGRLYTKFVDKDYGLITLPNEFATFKPGKNSNTVIAFTPMGLLGELTLRVLLASTDDATLNSFYRQFVTDAPTFALLSGQIIKRSGDGTGTVRNVIYNLTDGAPVAIPEGHSNADGDEEQGVAVWKLKFARVSRQLL